MGRSGTRWLAAALAAALCGCGEADSGEDDAGEDDGPPSVASCFDDVTGSPDGPDYEPFMATVGAHCAGTAHQTIEGLERLVFLGDSVTTGTPPTPADQFYRTLVAEALTAQYPGLVVDDCSEWGARTDDLLEGGMQIPSCFPDGGDDRVTLTVFTVGGNDFSNWASNALPSEEAIVEAMKAADLLEEAVAWLKDEARFPNGSYVVYGNPYEFTDGTGDLTACPLATVVVGDTGNYIEGADAVRYMQERFMEVAVEHGADLVFSFEHFCGHGYHHDDPEAPCYLGPDAELWFDGTCTHPNPAGHQAMADLFLDVIGRTM